MTKISDLPRDLVEEVLSRVPVTSLRAMRFTCKNWNTFSKNESFANKHISQANAAAKKKQIMENLVIMTMNYKVYLMSVNLHELLHKDENVECSIQSIGTLNSLNDGDQVVEYVVLHCNGLLLCIPNDCYTCTRLVVWNPYCGQIRRIFVKPKSYFVDTVHYALGYKINKKSHRCNKILRFVDAYAKSVERETCEFEIYDFDSNSWKAVKFTPDWSINSDQCGVPLKGNTYWSAENTSRGKVDIFLLSFDFTTERFGPRLPFQFKSFVGLNVILSSVREKNLAVLFQNLPMFRREIWVSNKIEPNGVSWASKLFLKSYIYDISTPGYYCEFLC